VTATQSCKIARRGGEKGRFIQHVHQGWARGRYWIHRDKHRWKKYPQSSCRCLYFRSGPLHPWVYGLPSFESPLGPGFVSSIAHHPLHEPLPFASPQVPPLIAPKPSFTDFVHQPRGRGGQKKGNAQEPIPNVNPNSFAARIMAKIGYVPGQGLGTQGQGKVS